MNNITWKIFWNRIVKPWFTSEEKKLAIFGFVTIIILSLTSVYIGVLMNDWGRVFFDSISNKDLKAFKHQITIFIPIAIFFILDFCTRSYFTAWYSFRWRRWYTDDLQKFWLNNKSYYKIQSNNGAVDNPDQRIDNDTTQVTYGIISLFQAFFKDGINFITFSVILWNLSNTIPMSFFGITTIIPGFLVWVALVYSLLGIFITFKVGRPLIDLDRKQEKCEANFRYGLMRIKERSEEIASFGGENIEKNRLTDLFKDLTLNYYQILKRSIYINLFQNFYLNIQFFVPLFIVGPAYFGGAITLGVLMQIRGIFDQVTGSLMTIVSSYQTMASLIASMQRIINFRDHIELVNESKSKIKYGDHIEVKNLIITTNDGEKLWSVPNISIKHGEHTILMAPSGTGKTSLLRILAGLKDNYEGEALVPHNLFYVPQRPYMPVGTLRKALSYPLPDQSDEILIPLMKKTHLEHLVPLLDEVNDYQHNLSVGEQQRVNFVRIFLHKPEWLMIDEPFANLNSEYIEELSLLLKKELQNSGILIISHNKLAHFPDIIKG